MDEKKVVPQKAETVESLPSLATIFKPEEFFEMDPIEETSLSRICCGNE